MEATGRDEWHIKLLNLRTGARCLNPNRHKCQSEGGACTALDLDRQDGGFKDEVVSADDSVEQQSLIYNDISGFVHSII